MIIISQKKLKPLLLNKLGFQNKEKSHFILNVIFISLFVAFIASAFWLSIHVNNIASKVKKDIFQTMDAKSPDPGKTSAENTYIDSTVETVMLGIYLERI